MPISADPNRTFDYWLECDAGIPIETRPVLVFRHPTRRQRTHALELREEAVKIGSGPDAWKKVHESIGVCLVGWKNQTLPPDQFALDRLGDIFDDGDIIETMGILKPDGTLSGWLARATLAADELRFFGLGLPENRVGSANPAAQSAPTDPANPTPSPSTAPSATT
jgi:hypothetical protein